MVVLSPKSYHRNKQAGMTLIEVLIALAIVSIAMTAIIKATTQSIRGTSHLQNKMIATWVAQDVINEFRVKLRELPDASDREKINMLNQDWYWQAEQTDTANPRIKKMEVNVYTEETGDADPLVTLISYVYQGG